MVKFLITFFLISAQICRAGITINGKITAANGETPKLAHAHVSLLGNSVYRPLETKQISDDGTFSFNLDNENYTLFITAEDHYGLQIPILTEKENDVINITARLDAYKYNDNMDDVKIIGDWNNFKFGTASNMAKQEDGTYLFELKSDSNALGYQLLNLETAGHSINGTNYDALEYDGGGDYKSYVNVKDGIARIIFDPKKLYYTDEKLPSVDFGAHKALGIINQIQIKYNEESAKNRQHKATVKDGSAYNWTALAGMLENYLDSDENLVKRFAATKYTDIIYEGYQSSKMNKVLDILPITDPLWELDFYTAYPFLKMVKGKVEADKYIDENFSKIKSVKVRASLLAAQGLDAKASDNPEKAAEIFNKLDSEYANVSEISYFKQQLDPNNAITKGKQVPDFEVKLIHSDEIVSRESMLGKFYLLDFWAVWCGPCRREMPNMHQVYKDFNSKNFTILSLSFDPKLEDVDKYRKESWEMPWLHTFVDNGFKNDLSKRFEVTGIPKPVLVNPQGIIIATGMELRGDELRKTLEKYLNTTM